MTFASDTQVPTSIERDQERGNTSPATVHIEETPCMVMPAVVAPAVTIRLWQPRTMHAWLT